MAFLLLAGCKSQKATTETPSEIEIINGMEIIDDEPGQQPGGAPAVPDLIHYELPDGYILKIYLRGDENYHYAKSTDGFFLILNPEGYYEYSYLDDQGLLQSTRKIARNPEDRSDDDWRILNAIRNSTQDKLP